MDLTTRTLYIAAQHPCENPYARWQLDELFTTDALPGVEFAPAPREVFVA
jgi:hypothetical protein